MEGRKVPSVIFKMRVRDESIDGDNPFKWQDANSDEIFKDKKVVIFSLPGAFTPTCSSTHLPGFEIFLNFSISMYFRTTLRRLYT